MALKAMGIMFLIILIIILSGILIALVWPFRMVTCLIGKAITKVSNILSKLIYKLKSIEG